jgi:hypothetical protein
MMLSVNIQPDNITNLINNLLQVIYHSQYRHQPLIPLHLHLSNYLKARVADLFPRQFQLGCNNKNTITLF